MGVPSVRKIEFEQLLGWHWRNANILRMYMCIFLVCLQPRPRAFRQKFEVLCFL